MDVIIEPGQSKNLAFDIQTQFKETFGKNLAFDIQTQFNESLQLLHVVRPNILDWPNITHEYKPQEIKVEKKTFPAGIDLPHLDIYAAETKLDIAEKFKTAFLDDASYWATYVFLRDTIGQIKFEDEEYAENVVPWDFINPADHDNIRGLSFEQILYAQNLLESRRLPSENLVLIAPVIEKLSLMMRSNALLYTTAGIPGAPLNSQITNDIMGIPIWWVPNTFFIECGLCTDDIDGEHANHHGIYVYMVNRDDLYFITSLGSEVIFGGKPWIYENPEYQNNGAHLIMGRYAIGAAMKNYENCIRIDCRLD